MTFIISINIRFSHKSFSAYSLIEMSKQLQSDKKQHIKSISAEALI